MKTKPIIASAILVLSLVASNVAPAYARGGADDVTETEVQTSPSTSSGSGSSSSRDQDQRGDDFATKVSTQTVAAVRDDLKQELETKRAEAKQKIEDKKAEVKQKLADKRLETCQKREARINAIVDKAAVQAQQHLGVFEKIEDRVKTFYTDKKLSVANYDTLVATVDEKHTSAAAAVDELKATKFSCTDADATNPSGIMKDIETSKNDALKEYRAALKDLIVAVKGASSSTDDTTTTTTPETETN